MSDVGDVLAVLEYLKQKREKEQTPILGEIQQFGMPEAARTFGDQGVAAALKASGVNVPSAGAEGMMTKSPFGGQMSEVKASPIYPSPTFQQDINKYIRDLPQEAKTKLMGIKAGLLPSAGTEETLKLREEQMNMMKEHYQSVADLNIRRLEDATKWHEQLTQAWKDKAEAQTLRDQEKAESRIKELQMKFDYDRQKQQLEMQNKIDLLGMRMEYRANPTPEKLGELHNKARDDARAMATLNSVAKGYGKLVQGPAGPTIEFPPNSTEGPKLFQQEYENEFNNIIGNYEKMGISGIPRMGKSAKQKEHEAGVEKATKEALKPRVNMGVTKISVGTKLDAKQRAQVIKTITDAKAQGMTVDQIANELSARKIDPDEFMEYMR